MPDAYYKAPLLDRFEKKGAPYFVALSLLGSLLCWGVIYMLFHSWPLLVIGLVTTTLAIWVYADRRAPAQSVARVAVALLGIANLVAGIAIGGIRLHHLNTVESTSIVVVCGLQPAGHKSWEIATNEGRMHLDPGFYDGIYYPKDELDQAGTLLMNKTVRVTHHGYRDANFRDRPFITEAATIREDGCAK